MSELNQNTDDFLEVLLTLKANIFRDLKVATLGIVKEIKDKKFIVNPFPTIIDENKERNIETFCIDGLQINQNDIVVVLFLDRNFIQNLNQATNNQKLTQLNKNVVLHSENFGIIIGKISL